MKHFFLIAIFILTYHTSVAQSPYLGAGKIESEKTLRLASQLLNEFEKDRFGSDLASTVTVIEDTLIYQVSTDQEVEYKYIYSDNKCSRINVRFSCFVCLNLNYRKWLFKGKWKVDSTGYLVSRKYTARASIMRSMSCPYLYEISLTKLNYPVSKKAFRKMRKIKKKQIGSRKFLMREELDI